jgi:hypothetical protein
VSTEKLFAGSALEPEPGIELTDNIGSVWGNTAPPLLCNLGFFKP